MTPRGRSAWLTFLLVATTCAAPAPRSDPETVMLLARWPAPARFAVAGTRDRTGRRDEARFVLATEAVPGGLEVRLADPHPERAGDPRLERILAEGLVALRVGADAKVTGQGVHQDLPAWTAEVRERIASRDGDGDGAGDPAVGRLVEHVVEEATDQMARTLRLVWWAAVDLWSGARLTRGVASGLTTTTRALPWAEEMPFASDSLAVSVQRVYEGDAVCDAPHPGGRCVRLSAQVSLDPATRRRLRERQAAQLPPGSGTPELRAEARILLVTDADTLVPSLLELRETRTVIRRGPEGGEQISRDGSVLVWRFQRLAP